MQQPILLEKPSMTIAGFGTPFIHALSPDANAAQVVGPLWDRFIAAASEVPHRVGGEMFGIVSDLPEGERSHRHELHYLAGVRVSSTAGLPATMTFRTIPAALFAVFTHRGVIASLRDTVHAIYRTWLPQSAYEQADVPDVELYDHRFCPEVGTSEMEYWIAVRPKAAPNR